MPKGKGMGAGRPALPNPKFTTVKLFTADEAAEYFNTAVSDVQRWFREGRMRTYQIEGKPRRYTTLVDMAAWYAIWKNIGGARERAEHEQQEREQAELRERRRGAAD